MSVQITDPLHAYFNFKPPFIARLKHEALNTMKKISSILKNEKFIVAAVAGGVAVVAEAAAGVAAGVAAAAAKAGVAVVAEIGLGTLGAIGIIGIGSVIMIRALKKRNPELQKQAFFKAVIKNYIQELDEGEIGTEDVKTQRGFLDAVEASFPEPMEELNRYLVEEIIRSEIDVTERSIPQFLHFFLDRFRDLKTNYAALSDGEKQSFNIRKDGGLSLIEHDALNLVGEIYTGGVLGAMYLSFSKAAAESKRELGF